MEFRGAYGQGGLEDRAKSHSFKGWSKEFLDLKLSGLPAKSFYGESD